MANCLLFAALVHLMAPTGHSKIGNCVVFDLVLTHMHTCNIRYPEWHKGPLWDVAAWVLDGLLLEPVVSHPIVDFLILLYFLFSLFSYHCLLAP